MRILLVGAGGVGAAAAGIAARRDFFDGMVVADYDADRAGKVVARLGDSRFTADRVDASSGEAITELCRAHRITHVLNAVDPRFVMPVFSGAFAAGADYLDMAMSLSRPDPEQPYERTGVKLGDDQFAAADAWRDAGRLALVGIGVEPGLSDVFARYAADHLFSRIDEIGVRDGSNLVVQGHQEIRVNYEVRDLQVTGVLRPADISSINTVPLDKLAEARVSYGGRGQLTNDQQPRYGQQLLDIVAPF